MIHEITRSEITRRSTNNILCQFVSLVRVVSWIVCLLKRSAQGDKKLTVLILTDRRGAVKLVHYPGLHGVGSSGRLLFMFMPKARSLIVLLLLTQLLLPFRASASVRHIWAVNDGEKVERDDLSNPNKGSNSAWNGSTIKIFGARNEIIAFQLIVEAGPDGIKQLSVKFPELRQQGGTARITHAPPGLDPTDYVGRPIELFSVNYMNVEIASHADWIFKPGSPAAPKDPTGWKPVQLVPENARPGRGGFPLRIDQGQNQAVWIEVSRTGCRQC